MACGIERAVSSGFTVRSALECATKKALLSAMEVPGREFSPRSF